MKGGLRKSKVIWNDSSESTKIYNEKIYMD